ncbi:auxin-induced in root cultures protein 12 [Phtheirospermum japonicum]|uniref:Auxin-induced in root cultures protein 12 n=1 Tax=Phtheirospermum japonicum TaxID=374723 RepID=A0A830CMC7_9LAMI|nr:auxin-induced in root cultures protein 12 [Phtheirospermum japonicum]
MASSSLQLPSSLLLLLLAAVALLISPASSQTCRSQSFNQTYANCRDLPTLRAYLHWTYNPSARPNPTLDIAFIAPPATRDGWIAWALNPTRSGMLGSQSLIAFRDGTNGSMVVRTYNITSYASIAESPIAYEVLSRRAESSDGVMRIFATLALPAGHAAELNQVWQVGAAVRNGVPARHDFSPANLNSTGTLRLGSMAEGPAPAPTSGNGGGGTQGGNDRGGSWRVSAAGGLGLYGGLVLLGVFLGF